jgi:hypothetical protein
VVVAVVAMRMVQVAIDEVIDVVAMRHGFMTATRSMNMAFAMSRALMLRRAPVGVGGRNLDHMLIDMPVVHVVQMTIMQVIDVAIMADGGMAAARPVDVVVIGVL